LAGCAPASTIGMVLPPRGTRSEAPGSSPAAAARDTNHENLRPSRKHGNVIASTQGITVPLNVRSEEVNQLAEKLAARKRINKTEAVKLALENELRRLDEAVPLRERLRPLQRRVLARPKTGLEADKAFYDDLSGDI
jgi:antitoxin VapB